MRLSKTNVNRVQNGCDGEFSRQLNAIEEDPNIGPGKGLGADDPYLKAVRVAALERVSDDPTLPVLQEVCKAVGSIVVGLEDAGGLSSAEGDDWRGQFLAKASDAIDVEYGDDAYDSAAEAFDAGASEPRTELGDIAERQQALQADPNASPAVQRRAVRIAAEEEAEDAAQAAVATVRRGLDRMSDDPGALFEREVLNAAADLKATAAAHYHRCLAMVKDRGASLLKPFERAIAQYERAERQRAAEEEAEARLARSQYAARGGEAGAIAKQEEAEGEELPECSAFEYGTRPAFDPRNEYFVATLHRLMNRDYAVVPIGGDVRILETRPGGPCALHRVDAMRKKFENIRIPVLDRKSPVNAFDAWMQLPARRTCAGMGFYPHRPGETPEMPEGHFNTWRGYAIDPVQGEWPLLRRHMLNVYCGGDKKLLRWLLDWVAQMLQEPQKKPGTSIVLRSRAEGTGKSLFAALMQKILGGALLSASQPERVAGRFNSHLQDVLLLVAEEAVFAGSKQAQGVLKDMITCSTMGYEAKGLSTVSGPNYTRLCFISNEDHVVFAGPTSRRFAVFDCNNSRAGDENYFNPLFAEIECGGAQAFLYDMLGREITSNLRKVPVTPALLEQRAASLDGFGKWLLSVAQSGQIDIPDQVGGLVVQFKASGKARVEVSTSALKAAAKPYLDPYEQRAIDPKLGRLLKEVGALRVRVAEPGRPWGYRFPSLPMLREATEKRLGVELEAFEDEDEDEDDGASHGRSRPKVVINMSAYNKAADQLRRTAH